MASIQLRDPNVRFRTSDEAYVADNIGHHTTFLQFLREISPTCAMDGISDMILLLGSVSGDHCY